MVLIASCDDPRPPLSETERSRIPELLVLVALGVLALAFAGALFGSFRGTRWEDDQRKAELVEPELAEAAAVLDRARELDDRWRAAAARSPQPIEPSPTLTEVRGLVLRVSTLPPLGRPSRTEKRSPSRAEILALEEWLDFSYRRLAAAKDLEARLPVVEQEVVELERRVPPSLESLGNAPLPEGTQD